ncbi:MAG: hypothetical protein ACRDX8_00295 [Acidimicrobiales bacterium]
MEPLHGEVRFINGSPLTIYADAEPDRLWGPQFPSLLRDELASWYGREGWDRLLLACRLGSDPQIVVTTTTRYGSLCFELVDHHKVNVVRESTYATLQNLAPSLRDSILSRYGGTTLARQKALTQLLLGVD